MAATHHSPSFETTFDPRTGLPVAAAPGVVRVTAPNAGPYTFTGTNSFNLGDERVAILDPGPADATHLAALLDAIGGRPVEAILLTHTHHDHCAIVPSLRRKIDAPLLYGADAATGTAGAEPGPGARFVRLERDANVTLAADRLLRDGERLAVAGVEIEVIATPGHAANHLCFGLAGTPWLLSGDHVMGWNSTMILPGAGALADYLGSLERLIALSYAHYLPAHGGPVMAGPDHARRLLAHRQMRNEQILDAIAAGARDARGLLRAIYPGLAPALRLAAEATLLAHIEYLEGRGEIAVERGAFGIRVNRGA